MCLIASIVFSLFLGALEKQDETRFSEWDAWASFGEGSWVQTLESFTLTKKRYVTKRTTTLVKKEGDKITLEITRKNEELGTTTKRTRILTKPKGPTSGLKTLCPACKKVHPTRFAVHRDQTLTLPGGKLSCFLFHTVEMGCLGKRELRVWYSKDVPGWFVKSESVQPLGTAHDVIHAWNKN